ncbi:dicarboxylate/amino acid:cation symporter [Myxococcota bacterium]|nr:dicarboxylate/amino acid:cation symporter [Myxococcota bacterium]
MSTQAAGSTGAEADGDDAGRLTRRILIGLLLGAGVGLLLRQLALGHPVTDFLIGGVFAVGGKIFLASLQLLVVPLVLVSLTCGTAALDDVAKLGRIGGKTLGLYLMTTAIAISLAVVAALLIEPGAGFELSSAATGAKLADAPSFAQTLIEILPTNPFQALSEGKTLQVIVFAILLGIAMTLSGEAAAPLLRLFESANVVVMKLVFILMELAPFGVFCLIAKVASEQGFEAFGRLAWYFGTVLLVLFIHAFFVYPLLLVLAGLSPLTFFRKFRAPMSVAFSTASSNATLPVNLKTTQEKLGVDASVASFTIPLGATVNMDGTAIMQGVATVFIAQVYGVEIGPGGFLTIVVTATLASIGTAGVPGVGMVMLAMVLRQMELPVEGIGLILGVDRLLDMSRTVVNITGDAIVSCVVAKSEGKLDLDVYRS